MNIIQLTPAIIKKEFAGTDIEPRVTISKSMIAFNSSAVKKLSLEKQSKFMLQVENGKLYYRDYVGKEDAFSVENETKQHTMNAYCAGILSGIKHHLRITEPGAIRFRLGEFKEGRRELIDLNPAADSNYEHQGAH